MIFEKKQPEPFTLQKLLGIIVVVVVILLIMVPIISKLGNTEAKSDFEKKVTTLVNSIDDYVDSKEYQKPITFVFTKKTVIPAIDVDIYQPVSGSITILKNGEYIINQISNGELCISQSGKINNIKVKKIGDCDDLSSLIPIISDNTSSDAGNPDNGGGSESGENGEAVPDLEKE